jgi:hypothetical protein
MNFKKLAAYRAIVDENREDDPVIALACYWTAALEAQALRWLLTPPESVPSRP